jgi:lipopolysaccharide export system permease protein
MPSTTFQVLQTMKILDRYLIRSFIPPFFVAFGIALFVLIMQFLWLYIDEIMGKGLSIFEVTELLFYLSIGLFPQAFPIGVLIASVMVMGNLGERYELSSFKSAGTSLLRIMRPLMFVAFGITLFSIFTSEILIPWSNLKFYSRFYDIRKSKPALNLEAGVFNDEFSAYTMRVGNKSSDGTKIENVLIYGNKEFNTTQYNQTTAKTGEMLTTADKQFFVMNLYDGMQYQETTNNNGTPNSGKYPFVRIKFKSWQKIFDLSEFDRRKTDEDLFRSSQKTQSSRQMLRAADSMSLRLEEGHREMLREIREQLTPFKMPIQIATPTPDTTPSVSTELRTSNTSKVLDNQPIIVKKNKKKKAPKTTNSTTAQAERDSFSKNALAETPFAKLEVKITPPKDTFINKALQPNFYDIPKNMKPYDLPTLWQRSQLKARDVQSAIDNNIRNHHQTNENRSKFLYEMNLKYVFALICFVFLFIGAPMGAIVQKGGFGYPILVAIIFFMVFMIGIIYCKNMRDAREITGVQAAWIPLCIMLPIAAYLTWRAVNDYKLSMDGVGKNLKNFFIRIVDFVKSLRPKTAATLLVFMLFTEGVVLAQDGFPSIAPVSMDTVLTEEETDETVEDSEEDTPYISPYAEAQKQYLNEQIDSRTVAKDDWQKAIQGIDYQKDVEKEQQRKTTPTNPNDGKIFLILISILKWVFIIGAALLLAYLIYRFVGEGNIFLGSGRRIASVEDIDLEDIEENLEQAELNPLIKKAIEARNFPLATRLYYLAILKELTLKGAIAWKRDKTNRTYVSEMRSHNLFESFRSVTGIFERVWYGDTALDAIGFEQIQPSFQHLLSQTRKA